MKTRLFVVHGYQAQVSSHWFAWLCRQFPATQTQIITLPDSHHPQLDAWLDALHAAIGAVDEHTFIVAHSLGCITTLQYLNRLAATPALGGLVLVAGFAEALAGLPELNGFSQAPLNWAHLQALAPQRLVVLSEDDAVVPAAATTRLSAALQAPLLRLNQRGHFMSQDGCDTLPEVAIWLRQHLPQLTPANGMM